MIYTYLCGAASALAATAGVFFLRYWRDSRDRFFAIWAVALALMAAQWGVSAFLGGTDSAAGVYLLRLAAFALIIGAIVDKNRGGAGGHRRRERRGDRAAHAPAAAVMADQPGR